MLTNKWETKEDKWMHNPATEIIILGDFNWHHRTWEAMHNNHLMSPDRLLNPLLDLIVSMQLEMALLHDIPTLEACNLGNWTCLDNVWRNIDSPSPFISCSVNPSICPANANHLPIISVINLTYIPSKHKERFNYKNIDWKAYKEVLENNLTETATLLTKQIKMVCAIKTATNILFKAINKTTREVVPLIKITPHTKC